MDFLSEDRRAYYRAKRREVLRKQEADLVIKEDALFIKHYGMSAFLELVPEAKYFGIGWHRQVIEELEHMRQTELARLLSGIYSASAATKDKSANRRFRTTIKDMFRRK